MKFYSWESYSENGEKVHSGYTRAKNIEDAVKRLSCLPYREVHILGRTKLEESVIIRK